MLSNGDANGDRDVDAQDLLIWRQQFGSVTGTTLVGVPEPPTLLQAWIFLVMLSLQHDIRQPRGVFAK